MASNPKKQHVEVRYRDLDRKKERQLFDEAQRKEVQAWVGHGTVIKKLTKGTLNPEQIMRSRWILTWKNPLPGSPECRAKARFVIFGFEDPGLGKIDTNAPTLSKDGRQLLLQQVSSNSWPLINFDVSTAFLRGKGDGRELGMHAPVELKSALQMSSTDRCGLTGGAYGRADAPLLWYNSFRKTLEGLGFVACPFDGCVFSLITKGKNGVPKVRRVLGIHVDDGIGGGDSYFQATIQRLKGNIVLERTMKRSLTSAESTSNKGRTVP